MTDPSRGVYSGSKDSRRALSRAVTCREAAYLNPSDGSDAAGDSEGREEW
jgi:hypothetical protein